MYNSHMPLVTMDTRHTNKSSIPAGKLYYWWDSSCRPLAQCYSIPMLVWNLSCKKYTGNFHWYNNAHQPRHNSTFVDKLCTEGGQITHFKILYFNELIVDVKNTHGQGKKFLKQKIFHIVTMKVWEKKVWKISWKGHYWYNYRKTFQYSFIKL